MRRQVAMTWFRYERTAVIVAASVVLLIGLVVHAVSWRRVVKMDAASGMIQALATNLSGRVIVYVDVELGAQDGK